MRLLVAGIAVGFVAGAGGTYFYLTVTKQPRPSDSQLQDHPALKYGSPNTEVLRAQNGYVLCYDYRTKNPKWVVEHLAVNQQSSNDADRNSSTFFEDPDIEPRFRSKLQDYRGTGYDRGHLAAAANHKDSQETMNETFNLVNISPQVGQGFNRDYWSRFERFVRTVAKRSHEVFVATGPLWLPSPDDEGNWTMVHKMIGSPPRLVSVPTHFYKVVVAEGPPGLFGTQNLGVGAFVMPNAPIDPRTPLSAFVVPLEALEAVAGTQFFPELLNDRRREALDQSALLWQQKGQGEMKAFDRKMLTDGNLALLPLPPAAAEGKEKKSSKKSATVTLADVIPITVGGQGAVHLCEFIACKLPSEYKKDNGEGNSTGRLKEPEAQKRGR